MLEQAGEMCLSPNNSRRQSIGLSLQTGESMHMMANVRVKALYNLLQHQGYTVPAPSRAMIPLLISGPYCPHHLPREYSWERLPQNQPAPQPSGLWAGRIRK